MAVKSGCWTVDFDWWMVVGVSCTTDDGLWMLDCGHYALGVPMLVVGRWMIKQGWCAGWPMLVDG